MQLLKLNEFIKKYDREKGMRRRVFGDAQQITILKALLNDKKNQLTYESDLEISFLEYQEFAKSKNYALNLSNNYLESGTLSANFFLSWKYELDSTIQINPLIPPNAICTIFSLPQYNIDQSFFQINDTKLANFFIPSIAAQNMDLPEDIKRLLFSRHLPEPNFLLTAPESTLLKEATHYQPQILQLLGEEIVKCTKLFSLNENLRCVYRNLLIELGKMLINRLLERPFVLSDEVVGTLASFIKVKKYGRNKDTIFLPPSLSREAVEYFLIEGITHDPIMPFVIMLKVAKEILTLDINNPMDFIVEQFSKPKCAGAEIASYIVSKLNKADERLAENTDNVSDVKGNRVESIKNI